MGSGTEARSGTATEQHRARREEEQPVELARRGACFYRPSKGPPNCEDSRTNEGSGQGLTERSEVKRGRATAREPDADGVRGRSPRGQLTQRSEAPECQLAASVRCARRSARVAGDTSAGPVR